MNKPMCIQKLLISLFPSSVFTFSSSKAPLCIFSKLTSSSLERFVLNSIVKINDDKETWKIVVRLINMCTIPRSPRFNIELIFIDKEVKLLDLFSMVYPLVNFEVEKNSGQYKATQHAFKINFVKATKITAHEILEIRETMYNFTMFDTIVNYFAIPNYLIVSSVGLCGRHLLWSLRNVWIAMLLGQCCCCCLWLKSKNLEFKCLILCNQLLMHLSYINTEFNDGSQIFMNSDFKEIYGSKLVNNDSLYSKRKLDFGVFIECMCVIVATITKLLVANGLIYDACPKCNRKVDGEALTIFCHNCDLINMSYVEATLLSDYGRFVDLVNEEVNKHRLIFVSSVGNSGPRLSTIGAPGGTSSSIIGVGAYVSPAMVVGAHCVVEPPSDELEYTWYIHFSQNFLIDKFVVHC
ncbi:Tripeptidyl-peptidase 2 [Glycine max]|nr:Tripeptidyl-peptidase 2 [Glycine max]